MRKIIASTFVSLDGVMQAPGGPQEDPSGGFKFGGWVAGYADDTVGETLGDLFGRPFDLLLGRKTYDIFAAHWPYAGNGPDDAIAKAFNSATKYVASRSQRALTWQNSVLLRPDAVGALRTLKAADGPDLLVQGSGNFLQTLWRHGLVDEFTVFTFPVLLGGGKRLFDDGVAAQSLKLVRARSGSAGVVAATYLPDGAVRTGDFTLREPSEAELERRRDWQ